MKKTPLGEEPVEGPHKRKSAKNAENAEVA